MPNKLLSTNALSYIKDNFLKNKGGSMSGTLYLEKQLDFNNTTYSDVNRLIVFQNQVAIGVDSGAKCLTLITKGETERQIVINAETGGQWTSLFFNRNTSFPLGTSRNVASEERVNNLKASIQDVESLRGGGN